MILEIVGHARRPIRQIQIRRQGVRLEVQAPLHLTDIIEVLVHPYPVLRRQRALQRSELLPHDIQDGRCLRPARGLLLRRAAIPEQSLENHPRIDLHRHRIVRCTVGYRGALLEGELQ